MYDRTKKRKIGKLTFFLDRHIVSSYYLKRKASCIAWLQGVLDEKYALSVRDFPEAGYCDFYVTQKLEDGTICENFIASFTSSGEKFFIELPRMYFNESLDKKE